MSTAASVTVNRTLGTRIAVELGSWSDRTGANGRVRVLCETHGDSKLAPRAVSQQLRQHADETDDEFYDRLWAADDASTVAKAKRELVPRPWEWCAGCKVMHERGEKIGRLK